MQIFFLVSLYFCSNKRYEMKRAGKYIVITSEVNKSRGIMKVSYIECFELNENTLMTLWLRLGQVGEMMWEENRTGPSLKIASGYYPGVTKENPGKTSVRMAGRWYRSQDVPNASLTVESHSRCIYTLQLSYGRSVEYAL